MVEVDRMTRRGATLNVFPPTTTRGSRRSWQDLARRNGGRVLAPRPRVRLGQYVVSDYLSRRAGRRPVTPADGASRGGRRPRPGVRDPGP